MLFGDSGELQTQDRIHNLAAALFDTIGPEKAMSLAARLAEEIDAGGTRAQCRRELEARDLTVPIPLAQAQAVRTLDRARPYAEVHGDDQGRRFEQDGAYFRGDGAEAGR